MIYAVQMRSVAVIYTKFSKYWFRISKVDGGFTKTEG
jgi:hypothetical protein